jgi:hypothetical protein
MIGNLEQLRRLLPLLPQRRPGARVVAREEERPGGALPESGGEQGGAADLVGDELFQLVGVEDEKGCVGRLGVGVGDARDDAVVAGDAASVDAVAFPHSRGDREGPRGVHLHAEGRMHDYAPVAEFVPESFDDEGTVGRQMAGRGALVGQEREQVAHRPVIEAAGGTAGCGLVGGKSGDFTDEGSDRFAEFGGAA